MRKVNVRLIDSANPSQTPDYTGYYIVASFILRTIDGLTSSGLKVDLDKSGNGVMYLPANNAIEHDLIHFEFYGPGGFWVSERITLAETVFSSEKYDSESPFVFSVPLISVQEYSKATYTVSGRLIDVSAKSTISKLTFYVAESESQESAEPQSKIVSVVTTDFDGYFKFDMAQPSKNGANIQYFALIPQSIEKVVLLRSANNAIEDRQILGITPSLETDTQNDPGKAPGDCACEDTPRLPSSYEFAQLDGAFSQDLGVGCVEFTKPNRTIEEYEFYHIVRTTDPAISKVSIKTQTFKEILTQLEKNLLTEDLKGIRSSLNRKLPKKMGQTNKEYFVKK